ncbi:MAG: hypothetical protein AB7H80_15150 [Candidatus Kapaibacterium sp.]
MNCMRRISRVMPMFALLCGLLTTATLYAQEKGKEEPNAYPLRYNFTQGESVTYRVISLDSLVIWDVDPRTVIRQRVERITYRCDTILPEGYGMTMILEDVVVRERVDSLPWSMKTEHPWVGQPIRFLMGVDGNRLRLRDTLAYPGSMPGAPFQPMVIPHLGGVDTVSPGAGSIFDRDMWLLDNVYPPVKWQGGGLRKIRGVGDTLGHHAIVVELSETGQVWYSPPYTGKNSLTTHTVVNGSGTYWISLDAGYPVAGDHQLIGNITFTSTRPDGTEEERSGRQIISMIFSLDDLSSTLDSVFEETP